jgi:hypothetical protein
LPRAACAAPESLARNAFPQNRAGYYKVPVQAARSPAVRLVPADRTAVVASIWIPRWGKEKDPLPGSWPPRRGQEVSSICAVSLS